MHDVGAEAGTPLRNSLWNLLYRVVSSNDHSRTAWGAILRGSCLAFFKEPIDDLPSSDNDASRRSLKELFFRIPDYRVYDLYEFLLTDDRAEVKEADRKLIRRGLNRILEEELAPVRLLRDGFVPLPDELGLDAVMTAGEKLTLFDLDAASRHLQSAMGFLSRRPDPAAGEAAREALIAVAAVVHTLAGGSGEVALGTIAPVAGRLGIPPGLARGIESMLGYCHAASGLPGSEPVPAVDPAEASCLVVFCSSVVNLLLSRTGGDA
ncbi:MAG: hypothetical protein WBX50_05150 [Candidatus Deferrimicrobiaceae bacterium]